MDNIISIQNTIPINIVQDCTFIDFIGQFIKYLPDDIILAILNKTTLHFIKKDDCFGIQLKFTKKQITASMDEYYFQDYDNNTWCFFGYNNVKIVYPNIDNELSRYVSTSDDADINTVEDKEDFFSIIENGIRYDFNNKIANFVVK